jgi:MFS transporter, OPA family, solute carrier family 37 (glycerol-3-phosphate transporter), member 1/2
LDSAAVVLSTLFGVDGILAGRIFDHLDAQTLTATRFTFSAIPSLFFYDIYTNISLAWSIALIFSIGRPVNGPNVLITTVAFTVLRHWRSRLSRGAWQAVTRPVSHTGSRNEGHRRTWATVCGLGL